MRISFKQILCVFASIIIGKVIIVQFLPKPKLSFSDKQELPRWIEKLNSVLPRKIGTIINQNYATLLSKDADIMEFMNMLVLSHSNLTSRMKNVAPTDSVDVTIPYVILGNNWSHQFRNQL